jgi:hypothetical protein
VTNNLKFTKNKLPIKDDIDENDVDDAIDNYEHVAAPPLNIINKSQKSTMEKYYCSVCKYFTDDISNMNKHKKTKKHVMAVQQKSSSNEKCIKKVNTSECSICCRLFTNRSTKCKHEQNCKLSSNATNNQNDMITMQQSQLKQYEYMLSKYENVIDNLVSLKKS